MALYAAAKGRLAKAISAAGSSRAGNQALCTDFHQTQRSGLEEGPSCSALLPSSVLSTTLKSVLFIERKKDESGRKSGNETGKCGVQCVKERGRFFWRVVCKKKDKQRDESSLGKSANDGCQELCRTNGRSRALR